MDVRAVAHAQAGKDGAVGAFFIDVAGADADAADGHADRELVEARVRARDVAVDEQEGRAGLILHIDLVNDACRLVDLGDLAFDAHQVADVLVRHRGLRRDELRLERGDIVGDDLDAAVVIAAEVQLDLTAVVGHAAVDADLHALGIVARDREDVDAARVVLHIDAVEERGVLVIA